MYSEDPVGAILLDRIRALLAQRPDVDEAQFFERVGRPTPSWRSEFLSGKRSTNDLRLVIAMARFFKVPIGYLLDEGPSQPDAATVTLLGAWKSLKNQRDRDLVLSIAVKLGSDPGAP